MNAVDHRGGNRIVVTDAQDRPGLAAVRCLSAAAYRVTATATDRWSPGLCSRYCSDRKVVSDPHEHVERYVDELEQLVKEEPHRLLLCGTDETVFAISARRDRFAPHVEIGLPSEDAVARALDKLCLASEATKVGLAPPEGQVCKDELEALEAACAFGFPVLVKGVCAMVEIDGALVRYPSRLVSDERELREAQQQIGTCVVQRRCAGSVLSFAGVATDQGLLATVLACYRRTWPPTAGYAAFSETIALPEALREQVQELVRAIGWVGIFELELIDGEDGVIRAIDFNPRPYGSMGLARAAGVPLSALWCAWLLGEDPKPATARPGCTYRWEQGDARRILWQLRNGDPGGALAAARPRRGTVHPYFEARDPLPFLAQCAELARVRWRHARVPE